MGIFSLGKIPRDGNLPFHLCVSLFVPLPLSLVHLCPHLFPHRDYFAGYRAVDGNLRVQRCARVLEDGTRGMRACIKTIRGGFEEVDGGWMETLISLIKISSFPEFFQFFR